MKPSTALQHLGLEGATGLVVWTTTPWTLPSNAAVAVHGQTTYEVLKVGAQHDNKFGYLVVAKPLSDAFAEACNLALEPVAAFNGAELDGTKYNHPFLPETLCLVVQEDNLVSDNQGTGLVHLAPGHGLDDWKVGQRRGLPVQSPVDDAGCYTAEVQVDSLVGKFVLEDGQMQVLQLLTASGNLLATKKFKHSYPYDWRTKKPTLTRTTQQFFFNMSATRDLALEAVKSVEWNPPATGARLKAMLAVRGDWCVSRQRSWGVPLPVFFHKETGDVLMTPEVVEHVAEVFEMHGSDAWWTLSVEQLLPPALRSQSESYVCGKDTLDVWFDSGSSWA